MNKVTVQAVGMSPQEKKSIQKKVLDLLKSILLQEQSASVNISIKLQK
jgi:hypothetical protein